MLLGRIIGTVVSSKQDEFQIGNKFLLADLTDEYGKSLGKGERVVLDTIGAGHNDLVMFSQGSSARNTDRTINCPVDAIILGIVDIITSGKEETYKKELDL